MHGNVLAFDVTALAQALAESLDQREFHSRCGVAEVADLRHLARLLRVRCARKSEQARAKRNKKFATFVQLPPVEGAQYAPLFQGQVGTLFAPVGRTNLTINRHL